MYNACALCGKYGGNNVYHFFVPLEQIWDGHAQITGDDVNHIANVLRMKEGEKLVISAGRGVDYLCAIESFQPESIELVIEEERPVQTELPSKLILFQALPKADKMEWIIQKAVELGAYEIVPVRTKRAVVKLDEKKAAKKVSRWQAIAEAAAKQSGRGIIPEVHEVVDFGKALEMAGQLEKNVIPYELLMTWKRPNRFWKILRKLRRLAFLSDRKAGLNAEKSSARCSRGLSRFPLGSGFYVPRRQDWHCCQ